MNNLLCPLIIINVPGLVDLKIIDQIIYIYIHTQYVKGKEMWWLMLYLKEMDNAIFMVRGGLMNEKKEKMLQTRIFMDFFFCIITRVKSQKEISKYLTYV